jgi:hypothetical protein
MWNGDVTKVLEGFLVTRGDIKRPAGTGRMTNERAGPSQGKPSPAVTDASGGGEPRIRLVANNTALRQRTAGAVHFLKIVGRE